MKRKGKNLNFQNQDNGLGELYILFLFFFSIYFSLSFIVPLLGTTTRKDRVKS